MDGKKKTLEQMLFEFAGKPIASNAAKNYKVFMEHWDEFQKEHDKGWSYLMIWKAMTAEGVFTFSYPSFTSYIRKVERRQKKATVSEPPQHHQPRIGRAEVGQNASSLPASGENVTRWDRNYF